jgi:hypothetical protein
VLPRAFWTSTASYSQSTGLLTKSLRRLPNLTTLELNEGGLVAKRLGVPDYTTQYDPLGSTADAIVTATHLSKLLGAAWRQMQEANPT